MMTRFSLRGLIAAAVAVVTLASVGPASGQSVVASFHETGSPAGQFTFTNLGTSATYTGVSIPVSFTFGPTFDGGATFSNAVATLSSSTTTHGSHSSITGLDVQPISNVSTLSFTQGGVNLLTVTFTGKITGAQGGKTGSVVSNTASGDFLTYTSAVAPGVSSLGPKSFTMSVENITPTLLLSPNGFLRSFTSTLGGTFTGTALVPEPASMAMFGFGILGTAVTVVLRRRKDLLPA